MLVARDPVPKLLSHRLRGFSSHEGSIGALDAALAAGVRNIEIDTRLTSDAQILVFHDTRLDRLTPNRGLIADYDISIRGRLQYKSPPPEDLPTLDEFVTHFSRNSEDAELFIDIKDYGAEQQHCQIINDAGVADRTWIVSWCPQILLRVHQLDPDLRLSFSHIPLTRYRRLLSRILPRCNGRPVRYLGRLLALASSGVDLLDVEFHLDAYNLPMRSGEPMVGRFPIHLLSTLPVGELARSLLVCGGSLGIAAPFMTPAYVEGARAQGFKVFVFTIDDPRAVLTAVARCDPDIIFTNNPDLFTYPWQTETKPDVDS